MGGERNYFFCRHRHHVLMCEIIFLPCNRGRPGRLSQVFNVRARQSTADVIQSAEYPPVRQKVKVSEADNNRYSSHLLTKFALRIVGGEKIFLALGLWSVGDGMTNFCVHP